MINISDLKKTGSRKAPKIGPGVYESVVKNVSEDPDYISGTAFKVEYVLTNANGETLPYHEIFFATGKNARTKKFIEYLEANGISSNELESFIGRKEILDIRKAPRDGRSLLTIASREMRENA